MGFVVLTGASGSGKTAIAEAIASRYAKHVDVYHFDRVGVPPIEQMIAEYGSGEAWQRAMTFEWMARLAATPHIRRCILLEGQMRLSFVLEAAAAADITNYALILLDCDDATRTRRLTFDRRSPDLANATMMNWAKYLRDEAQQRRCTILDTTFTPLEVCVEQVWARLGH
jgi:shikimate kinase